MNTQVSTKIVKLLKEKGFDLNYKIKYACFSRNPDATKFCREYPNKLSDDSFYVDESYDNEGSVYSCYITLNEFENIPTIADVVMWLYEKYDIWIQPYRSSDDGDGYPYFWCEINNKGKIIESTHFGGWFKAPKEAYEAAFEHCLTEVI